MGSFGPHPLVKNFLFLFAPILFSAAVFFAAPHAAHAAVITWDGGGADENWSTGANWVGDVAPGSSDVATFDATSTKNATIDATHGGSVAGVDINSGYSGTITQARALTVGSTGYDQADGTFVGSTQALDMNGPFTLSSGTFTPTVGTWTLIGNFTMSGGTLNGTGTTLTLDAACGGSANVTYAGDLTTATGMAVTLNKNCSGRMVVTSGTTLTALLSQGAVTVNAGGTLIGSGGTDLDYLENQGSFTAGAGVFNIHIDVNFDGTTNNLNAATTLNVDRNFVVGTGDTLTLNAAVTNITLSANYTNNGTFDISGRTLTFDGCATNSAISYTGNFNADTGASVAVTKTCSGDFTVSSGQTITASINATPDIIVAAGGTLIATGAFGTQTLTNSGSFTSGAGTFSSAGSVTFNGTTNDLSATITSMLVQGNLTIGSGSTVTLNPAVTTIGITDSYTNNGTFDLTGRTLNFTGCGRDTTLTYAGNFNTATGATVTVDKYCNGNFNIGAGTTLTAFFSGYSMDVVVAAGASLTTTSNSQLGTLDNAGSFTAGAGSIKFGGVANFHGTTNDLSAITSAYFGGTLTVASGSTLYVAPVAGQLGTGIANSGTVTSTGQMTLTANIAFGNTTTLFSSSVFPANIIVNHIYSEPFTLTGDFRISGDFTRTNGPVSNPASAYTLYVGGNLTVDSTANFGGSNLTIELNGTGTQNITNSVAMGTALKINKTSGLAQLAGTASVSTYACTVTAGTLFLNGYPLTCAGGLTVASAGVLQLIGSEFLTTPTLGTGSTVNYVGDGDGASDAYALKGFTYSNLTINPTDSGDSFGGTGTNTLMSGIVAYYPFTEGTGASATDSSGNGYTGTLTNMEDVDWSTDVPTSSFTNTYSLDLDGSNEYVTFGNPALLPSGASTRTVCAWGKTDTISGNHWMYVYGTPTNGQVFYLGVSGSSLYGAGWAADISSASFWSTGTWKHSCFVYTGSVERLYTGGTLLASGSYTLNTVLATAVTGRSLTSNEYWDGKVDEIRVYNRVLTTSEMAVLANGDNTNAATITSLTVGGDLTLASGTLTLPSGTSTISGNLVKTGGTFDANGGTVNLGMASQSITGTWTFANLVKSVTSAATLTLPEGVVTTATGTLTLQGASGQPLSLRSSTDGVYANIDAQSTRTLGYLDVQDSDNDNVTAMNCGITCTNSGHNVGWVFAPGITVGALSGNTTESGGTGTFTVVLDSPPSADVSIGVSSDDTTEGTVSSATLTFTTGNWDTPQTVTVTGVDDAVDDGDVGYNVILSAASSADGTYNGLDPNDVSVSNTDNDAAGFTVSTISGDTTEAGGTATFTVVLTSEPLADVSTGISSTDTTEGTVSTATLTFTTVNWATPQTVTVTGVNDDVDDGDTAYTITTNAASSADGGYFGIDPDNVSVTNTDDDTAGFTVSTISGNTTETGGTGTFTVVLTSEPLATVSAGVSSSDTTEGTASVASLSFTTANWSTPQTVTVTGVDDAFRDGDIAYTVALAAATSGDGTYAGINPGDVSLLNVDDDIAGFVISSASGNTTEAGVTATFTVALAIEPTDDVSFTLASNDLTEGTVAPASLLFTALNWNVPQTVTITGVNDGVDDGNVAYSIVLDAATSLDAGYDGANPGDVAVTNTDDDTAGFSVSAINTATTEAGGTATFTLVLTSEPTATVNVGVSSSDTSEGTVSSSTVAFTNLNWNTEHIITVTGVDDAIDDGSVAFTIFLVAATSADGTYAGLNPNDVLVYNSDNDTAGIQITESGGTTDVVEAGDTDTYTVVLLTEPTATVTITPTPDDQVEVSPASLSFTVLNWSTPQTVTVTAVDDSDVESLHAGVIAHVATSADSSYHHLSSASVTAVITDNDRSGSSGYTAPAAGSSITLQSPTGGEMLIGNSAVDITWETSGSAVSFVNLYYSENGGDTFTLIAANQPVSDVYLWHVPAITSDAVVIKIIGTDLTANIDEDLSQNFTIVSDTPVILPEPEGETEVGISPVSGQWEVITPVSPGDFIKSPTFLTVYYIDRDMTRHPFMDSQTFFTYQDSFENVMQVTDATLTTLSLGSPILPKSGVVLVKIQSDDKVYAITEGGVLHWIPSEELAASVYGGLWADYVIDVDPAIFTYFMPGNDFTSGDMVDTSLLRRRIDLK